MPSLCLRCALLLTLVQPIPAIGGDWPTYLANNQRNAKSEEKLDATGLSLDWTWRSPAPPKPAWSGPAKWDAYAGIRNLKAMRNYDPVYHAISAGDRLWFGSSSDDHVYCLDATSGQLRWAFGTDGPVRIAPTYSDGRLYFGSDDGFAYCVAAQDATPIWKVAARDCDRQIVNDGRMISQWPIRTGVTVDNGIAYFAASLLPWQESYLCAVDASMGSADSAGCYIKRIDEATMEGPMAVSPGQLLVVPQGRVSPLMFSIADGKRLKSLDGGGGSFVVVTPDSVFHGPGNKTGWLTKTSTNSQQAIASLKNANAIVVANDVSFVLTDQTLTATNYLTAKELWTTESDCSLSLILVGDTLFAGGIDEVSAFDAKTGVRSWIGEVDGLAYGLAAANGRLFVSTDVGGIYCFAATATNQKSRTADLAVQASKKQLDSLKPISPIKDPALLGHWVFQNPYVSRNRAKDLSGGIDATIDGRVDLVRSAGYEAIRLGGTSTDVHLTRDLKSDRLPRNEFSIETWARIDQPAEWGAFIGCFQDNDVFERGWLLGFNDRHPVFALCTKNGSGKLTYLKAKEEYTPRTWFHLAATYDGHEMRLYVNGELANSSRAEQGEIDYPDKASCSIGAYHDDNEHIPVDGLIHEIAVYRRALSHDEIRRRHAIKAADFAGAESQTKSLDRQQTGPWLRFTDLSSAEVDWRTDAPSPTVLRLRDSAGTVTEYRDEAAKTDHHVVLKDLRHQRLYHYRIEQLIDGQPLESPDFECDLYFNYAVNRLPAADASSLEADEHSLALARRLVNERGDRGGLCIVLGCGTGSLIHELARTTDLKIIAFERSADRAARLRDSFRKTGWYGTRIAVHHVDSLELLPITGRIANVVTSESMLVGGETSALFAESARLLAPGGIAFFGRKSASTDWPRSDGPPFEIVEQDGLMWAKYVAPELPGSGQWSHIYGSADNSHYGGEALARVGKADELAVQWVGHPGPRYQADRNGRKTPPLATGGRVFLQGLDRLITLDQYNGSILWSIEAPGLRRFNIPRDCGNWCADADSLYVAVREKCWKISADTGQIERMFDIPSVESKLDWGFVARHQKLLLGSAVRPGNIWLDFWGKEGWYDGTDGEVASKVCGDTLFAYDLSAGQPSWNYRGGLIVHSTISINQDSIFFVEARNTSVKAGSSRRLNDADFWSDQFLVAIDAATGKPKWERALQIEPGKVAFYSSCTADRIVLVSSNKLRYHIYTYSSADGSEIWRNSIDWGKGKADHGSHLSRPAIVGGELYVRPGVFDLATGKQSELLIPVGGCGTYAATDTALFFRAGSGQNSAMWNRQAGDYTMWNRLRPDCWLSTIPAGGMLLSPEGGGGCSCGTWLETSLGFIPKRHLQDSGN